MRTEIPFNGGTIISKSVSINNQRSVNWFPVKEAPGAKSPFTLHPTPGLNKLFTAGIGPGRSNGIEFQGKLHFDGALTLTHHATDLILPGGANITTAAGDEAEFVEYASGDWRCINYQKATVHAINTDGCLCLHKNLYIHNGSTAVSQVDIDADALLLEDSANNPFRVDSVDLTVDITSSGANGLDTGSEASSTWYHLWVISDGSTTAGLLSTSDASPTMPSGYIFKGYVGAIYNDSGSDFIELYQVDKRVMTKSSTEASGSATTPTSFTIRVPSTAKVWHGGCYPQDDDDNDVGIWITPTPDNTLLGNYWFAQFGSTTTAEISIVIDSMIITPQTLYYEVRAGDSAISIWTFGWEF